MHAFILAGGFATRLWPLTNKRAKPLLPLAGKPILDHIIEKIPTDIPISVSTNAAFEDGFIQWKNTQNRPIDVVIEQTQSDDQKLGALGALAQWITLEHIDDGLLILTGDNYLTFDLSECIEQQEEGVALIAAYDIGEKEKAKAFGTVIVAQDGTTVDEFEEKPQSPRSTLVNTGCSILPKAHIPLLLEYAKHKPDDLGGIFEHLIDQGHLLHCYTFTGLWFDIGSFEAYLDASQAIIGHALHCEAGATFETSEQEGSVVLGANCKVIDSHLKNVILFEDCTVEHSTLENCIVDRGSVLRGVDLEGKMLQENTSIEPV